MLTSQYFAWPHYLLQWPVWPPIVILMLLEKKNWKKRGSSSTGSCFCRILKIQRPSQVQQDSTTKFILKSVKIKVKHYVCVFLFSAKTNCVGMYYFNSIQISMPGNCALHFSVFFTYTKIHNVACQCYSDNIPGYFLKGGVTFNFKRQADHNV